MMNNTLKQVHSKEPSEPSSYSFWSWRHKAPLVILGLALVAAIVYGFVITGQRNALNTELKTVQSVLASTQTELASTKQTLTSTQSELASTKQTLASTQSELGSTQSELASTKDILSTTQAELASTERTLASTESRLDSAERDLASTSQQFSAVQDDLSATKKQMEAINAKLKLYEDTTGTKIFSNVQPNAKGADPIELVNNPAANNPTWQQLISFLSFDITNKRLWTEGVFVSGDFAEMLHNNAEVAGIRAALVGVFFEGQVIGHGLNAFKTADKGLVYAEPQSDGIAYVTKGKELGTVSLRQDLLFAYGYYEKLKADRDSYARQLEEYNRDVETYNTLLVTERQRRARLTLDQRLDELLARLKNMNGLVPAVGTPAWFPYMEAELKQRMETLISLQAGLAEIWPENMGIVERIEIYW